MTGAEMVIQNRVLDGVDGLAFLGGVLYAINAAANNIYRIPLDASGKAGDPVQIWTDQPIKGPDGMRASGDRLFMARTAVAAPVCSPSIAISPMSRW